MPGPLTAADALSWAADAMDAGRYWLLIHAEKRRAQRRVSPADIRNVLCAARRAEPYPDHAPRRGGTCWRIYGTDLDENESVVSVELYLDVFKRVLIVTVF